MDRLQSIEIFVKSVELGSFSAAAEAMGMSSQLVGKHIRTLEHSLGVQLINRTTRRQHLTDVGHRFYEHAKNILAEMSEATSMANEAQTTPTGKLRISAPISFGVNALAPLLPIYMQRYPDVIMEMSISNRMVDLIEEGFDVVFRVGELSDSGLIARELQPYRLILCASSDYLSAHSPILHPSDLQQHECLSFSHTKLRNHWEFLTPEGSMTIDIKGHFIVDSGEALMAAAVAGAGIILQPSELVMPAIQEGKLVEILPNFPVPTRPMHLLYPQDRRMTPKLRSFIDFTLEFFAPDGSNSKQ